MDSKRYPATKSFGQGWIHNSVWKRKGNDDRSKSSQGITTCCWSKAFETATKLDGLVPVSINGKIKSRVEHATGNFHPLLTI